MKVTVDYESLTPAGVEKATKPLVKLMTAAGIKPVSVMVGNNGRPRRVADISFREVTFAFADNQQATLRVKSTGDVYQLLINGKVTPVSEQVDPAGAAAELAGLLNRTRAAHQKRLAAVKMVPPPGATTARPKIEATLREQIAEVDAQIAGAREELAAIEAEAA